MPRPGVGLGVGGSKAGSYLRLIDSCFTQLKAQGPSRTCNESKEEEEARERRQVTSPWTRQAGALRVLGGRRRARISGAQTLVSLSLSLRDLLGPATRVGKREATGFELFDTRERQQVTSPCTSTRRAGALRRLNLRGRRRARI